MGKNSILKISFALQILKDRLLAMLSTYQGTDQMAKLIIKSHI